MDYLYDGSFEGFLCCIYMNYYAEKAWGIYPRSEYQHAIMRPYKLVETDEIRARKVYEAIESKISNQALKKVYHVFLSNKEDKENIALSYIKLGFKLGAGVDSYHSNPTVFEVQRTSQKVSFEVHRLTGLLRFSVLCEGPAAFNAAGSLSDTALSRSSRELLYGKIEPDHDVLELLGGHFSDRFKGDPFVIHDAKRKKALFCAYGQWYIAPIDENCLPDLSEKEKAYRQMWKMYFDTIAIKERTNPACQKRLMPVRYWKNLTEMRYDQ
ncbi:TIGR03915 family putative DNA repair protein [Bacillota bacterium]